TGHFSPQGDATVGTGLIFSLAFNRPIADRAAVERAVKVSARPAVEIAAHWFGHRRLDFRPRERWRPGTEITVDLRLRGVKAGPGAYGTQRRTVHYRVGRDQVSTIDAARHTMTVRQAGRVVAVLPVTAGDDENPTYNGKMVILERHSVTRMDGDTVGFGREYDIPDVPHAMRLTRSGTFLHGNYWAPPEVFGGLNTSHGCVGLKDIKGGGPHTPAGWFFDRSIVGDTVVVDHSPERTVAPDNGLGGWNMPWELWRAGSALG
ncbi:Ig-like domain-containing protein, partial [Streptomyces sp. NPDC054786]